MVEKLLKLKTSLLLFLLFYCVMISYGQTANCQDITVQLDASGSASIVAGDIDNTSTGYTTLTIDKLSFTCADIGANSITLTAGGVTPDTCSAIVTVVDNIDPTATCQNITVQLDASGNASIVASDIDNGSNDNCGSVTLSASQTAFTCADLGANNVTLTVDDGNGQTDTCSAVVTVVDNIDPTAICQNITVQLDATGNVTVSGLNVDNGSTDNCGIASYSLDKTDFDCSDIGLNTVILTVTDNSGNFDTCSATITVEDKMAPTVICQDISVNLDSSGNATITAAQIDNGSVDNCGISSLNISRSTFNCGNIGPNNVTLSVTDINGNINSCIAIVTIIDTADGASISISASPSTPICQGDNMVFVATPTNEGVDPHYQWYEMGLPVGSDSNTYNTSSLNNGDTVYVELRSGACNSYVTSNTVSVVVNSLPVLTNPSQICIGNTATLSPTSGGTWTSSNSSIATITNGGLVTPIAAGSTTFTFTDSTTGCSSTTTTVTINDLPVVTAPSGLCIGETELLSPTTGGTWTSSNPSLASVTNSGVVTGVSIGDATFTYTDSATGCSSTTTIVTVKELPIITSVFASPSPICAGDVSNLVVSTPGGSSGESTLVNYDFNSGSNYGSLNSQAIAGITSSVSSNDIVFDRTVNGTATGAAAFENNGSGKSLNLDDASLQDRSGSWIFALGGADLSNYTTFKVYFQARRGSWRGTDKSIDISYRKDGGTIVFLQTLSIPAGNRIWHEVLITLPNTADNPSSSLEFILDANDDAVWRASDIRIDNFQVQGVQGSTETYTYSWIANTGASSGLPANAGTALESNKNISVNPTVTTDYTVTVTNSEGCSQTEIIQVVVYPDPDLQIAVDYCFGINQVQVFAFSNNGVSMTYEWTTGETGNTIYIDTAQNVQVIGTTADGCTYIETLSVAQELITNGSFTDGNVGFSSDYNYKPDLPGLVPAGQGELWNDSGNNGYSITTDGQNVHSNFWGEDHTKNTVGSRNFMAVNGHGVTLEIWKQVVPVVPGNKYYFSAYAMSLNSAGNYAELQFSVNGSTVGSTAPLSSHANNNNDSSDNWLRFYGVWTAPAGVYVANVEIINLVNVLSGNDFAIDDISFGTFSPFLFLTSAAGTDTQTICENSEITSITYSVGHGIAAPAVTGLPAGLVTSFNGLTLAFSGISTDPPGAYTYTITTSGSCGSPLVTTGTIIITEAAVIDAGPDIPICATEVAVTMVATLSGSASTGTWSGGTGTFSDNGINAVYTLGVGDSGTVTLTYASNDPSGPCPSVSDTVDLILTPSNIADAGNVTTTSDCADTTITLGANGTVGQWIVTSGQNSGSYLFSDDTNPTSSFAGESGETYTLTWTLTNNLPCIDSTDSVTFTFAQCANIHFDGIDDNVNFGDNFNLLGNFSFEIWVKPNSVNGFTKNIFSKNDKNNPNSGYDLRLVNNTVSFYSNNSKIVSANGISTKRWYHIVVTFNGSTYKLYIDGIEIDSSNGSLPTANSYDFLIGAMHKSGDIPTDYYKGWTDELRIWNIDLTEEQIHQMMNQEIESNNGNVEGSIVPIPIEGLAWSDLAGYYQMNQGTTDIENGMLKENGFVSGKLLKITDPQEETAPLPYTSRVDGQNWITDNTWSEFNVWDPPNSLGVNGDPIEWNIVQLDHNVNSGNKDIVVSGLISNAGELTIMKPGTENEDNRGQMLWVTHYLKLDGSIDLVGESQLIQKPGSAQYYESMLDESSTGFIERDQQGIKNSFAYNYWASPVSKVGIGNNNPVTIEETLRDGTSSINPKVIIFGAKSNYFHADQGLTNPIKIASAWIWKYNKSQSAYANWIFLGSNTGTLNVTEGFTMKGVDGNASLDKSNPNNYQNYVFRGKPNNVPFGVAGTPLVHTTFTAPVDKDYPDISLTGNPFPSAIDANLFLDDNKNAIDGKLYFWEHWSSGTHEWREYQGGYAIYNKSGGVPAVTHAAVKSGGAYINIPGRYVPVGQGFYVISGDNGGPVIFKNTQRLFHRETDRGGSSSVFIKGTKSKKESIIDLDSPDDVMRIRLGFDSPDGFHRQVLAAFIEGATDKIDHLYDATTGDHLKNDAFFLQEDKHFVIQAFGEFNVDREIPITIFIDENQSGGIQKFMIDALENVPDDVEIYIKDNYNDGETYDIRNTSGFEIPLESGEHKDRFALAFKSRLRDLDELSTIDDGVTIYMNNTDGEIVIQKNAKLDFKQVVLFNYLGQQIQVWDRNINERNITLPVRGISTGIYIVNLETAQGIIAKKVLIE